MKPRSSNKLSRLLRCAADPPSSDGEEENTSPTAASISPFVRSPWIHSSSAVAPVPAGPTLVGSLIRSEGHVHSIAAAGEVLYTGSDSRNIRVWRNLRSQGGFKSGSGLVKSIVLFQNRVFTGHQDGRIRIWRPDAKSDGHRRAGTLPSLRDSLKAAARRHSDAVSCLALDAASGILYSASWDSTFKAWRLADSRCLATVDAHDDAVNAVAAAFGNLVLSGSADGTVKAWERDASGRHAPARTVARLGSAVTAIAVGGGKDGVVYCGASDGKVRFWVGGRRMEPGGMLRWHRMAVLCLAAAGNVVASGSADGTVRVWRRDGPGGRHERLGVLAGHKGPVKCLALEEDRDGGNWLLYSGGLDGSVRLWRVRSVVLFDRTDRSMLYDNNFRDINE